MCLYATIKNDKDRTRAHNEYSKKFSLNWNEPRILQESTASKPMNNHRAMQFSNNHHQQQSLSPRPLSQLLSSQSNDGRIKPILKQPSSYCCPKKSVSFDESRNSIIEIETGKKPNLFENFQGFQMHTLRSVPSEACLLNIYGDC